MPRSTFYYRAQHATVGVSDQHLAQLIRDVSASCPATAIDASRTSFAAVAISSITSALRA